MNKQESLESALEITTKDRQNDYGTAENNFQTIAEFWSTYMRARFPEANAAQRIELEPYDIAAMMVQMKTSRIVSSPRKEDNWVDIIGYGACGAEVTDDGPTQRKLAVLASIGHDSGGS